MVQARRNGATSEQEIEAAAFAKIMALYTSTQIQEAGAQVVKDSGRAGRGLSDSTPSR
jgi:hypothetical protein